jgi:hypothetical protein
MQKTARTILHIKNRKEGSMFQLQLRKKSLKEREPELLLKNKNNTDKFIMFHLDGYSICTNFPQLNCQPGVSKLRVVAQYEPRQKEKLMERLTS